ncbi:MAG: oxygen-dependent coproporphyrinogen oxidase [Marinifilaceae bacterium]
MKKRIVQEFKYLQDTICQQLEILDGKAVFQEDQWLRKGGGGGRSRTIQNGNILEKGGVNFSEVYGLLPGNIQAKLELQANEFFATGVSLIIHPENPHIPIVHMNVRYFELKDGTYWFGGGIDLTPIYIEEEEAAAFHQKLKDVCDRYHPDFYPKFKAWADDYFYLPHRKETRGIGGIFFDHLTESETMSKEDVFRFVLEVGQLFAPLYCEILRKKKGRKFSANEKDWQLHRRGRYVEFNLVLDQGTKFGLDTNGRTESILVSMPPEVKWTYQYPVEKGSKEEATLYLLRKGINWVDYAKKIS